MQKTPDEIKKGVRCLSHDRTHTLTCSDCEYHGQGLPPCRMAVHEDAIALIQQLQDDNAEQAETIMWMEAERDDFKRTIRQLEAERDATMTFLRSIGCDTCRYREVESWEEPCLYCIDYARWQWRGVQKEE